MHLTRLPSLALSFFLLPAFAFPQGNLTPPGAPAPTMKTLDQVEARTPISTTPFTITNSGSYYLTKNLAVTSGHAIVIAADGVTLDLNGFTLSSTEASPSGSGILISGTRRNIQIGNGHIQGNVTVSGGNYSGSGFGSGISYSGPGFANVRVTGLNVSGCLYDGINLGQGDSVRVEWCTVRTAGNYGIVATAVSGCSATEIGYIGISGVTATDCFASAISFGVVVDSASSCSGVASQGTGLTAYQNAINCSGITTSGSILDYGLVGFTATNCYGQSAGVGTGLAVVYAANSCYGQSDSGYGINAANATASNSYGISINGGPGVYADTATACWGKGGSSQGVNAKVANNCYGYSAANRGVNADVANSCYGISNSPSFGVYVNYIATGCYGHSASGTGLSTYIANSCFGSNSNGSSISYSYHYNMPPNNYPTP